ncbi:AAA family ATPase [Kitasatospora sp. NPDC094011]|uniref:AAA family ATPase n=1 Tax=Kitasatospora sp. NPDC094011 TaxID=3364090 RepID=UPI00380E4E92
MSIFAPGFLRQLQVEADPEARGYPFDLPVLTRLMESGRIDFDPGVTFLVGDNGSGKSTLIEALATAAGFNAEGGSTSFRFATRSSESSLGAHLVLRWNRRPRTGYFLRAESFYNVATEIERLDREGPTPLLPAYGGRSPHERSHGQSFLDLAIHRFGPQGLYILDEPEAALSVQGCLALMVRMRELLAQGSQFVVATHSPILLAYPGARILQLEADGTIEHVGYDRAEPVALTRAFVNRPDRFLRDLFGDEDPVPPPPPDGRLLA